MTRKRHQTGLAQRDVSTVVEFIVKTQLSSARTITARQLFIALDSLYQRVSLLSPHTSLNTCKHTGTLVLLILISLNACTMQRHDQSVPQSVPQNLTFDQRDKHQALLRTACPHTSRKSSYDEKKCCQGHSSASLYSHKSSCTTYATSTHTKPTLLQATHRWAPQEALDKQLAKCC